MTTFLELINDAYIRNGLLPIGTPPNHAQIDYALKRLTGMINLWAEEGLLVPGKKHIKFDSDESKSKYSIGLSGEADIEEESPIIIKRLSFRQGGNVYDNILELMHLTEVPTNPLPGYPVNYYYERSYPLAVIYLDCLPYDNLKFYIISEGYLTDGSIDAIDEVNMPRGYEETLMLNLSYELCSMGALDVTSKNMLRIEAYQAKSSLRKNNASFVRTPIDSILKYSLNSGSSRYRTRYRE